MWWWWWWQRSPKNKNEQKKSWKNRKNCVHTHTRTRLKKMSFLSTSQFECNWSWEMLFFYHSLCVCFSIVSSFFISFVRIIYALYLPKVSRSIFDQDYARVLMKLWFPPQRVQAKKGNFFFREKLFTQVYKRTWWHSCWINGIQKCALNMSGFCGCVWTLGGGYEVETFCHVVVGCKEWTL